MTKTKCFGHRLITIAAWVVGLIVLTTLHSAAGSAFNDNFSVEGQSARAAGADGQAP